MNKEGNKINKTFKSQHPEFFPPKENLDKNMILKLVSDAIQNKQKDISSALTYVQQHKQAKKQLFNYAAYGGKRVVQSMAFQKTVSQLMKKKNITRQQAVLAMLYDDFFSDLVQKGKAHIKKFWGQNKDQVLSVLKTLALDLAPKLLSIGGAKLKSSDPYSVDVQFLKSIFNQNLASQEPAPRVLLDPLGFWRNVSQYNIVTGSGGNCIVTICPQNALYGNPSFGTSMGWYPYVSVNPINTNLVYNGATFYTGPFNSQQGITVGWLPDCVKTYFQSTQSLLNASGKVYCGVYYQPPNISFELGQAGTFDATTCSITTAQIQNSVRSSQVVQVAHTVDKRRLVGRWIPNGLDFSRDLYEGLFAQGQGVRDACFIVLYFTGCTPSTTIGTLTVDIGASHKPNAQQQGLFDLKVRRAHPGTDRWIHQLKSQGVNLQFMSLKDVSRYVVQNFADLQIGGDGFCVDQALLKLGYKPFGRPWITVSQLEATYPGLAKYVYGSDEHLQDGVLVVDLAKKHAYVKNSNFVFGKTSVGRPIAVKDTRVLMYDPFEDLHIGSLEGLVIQGQRYSPRLGWQQIPARMLATDCAWIDRPCLHKNDRIQIRGGQFFLFEGGVLAGNYTSLPSQRLIPLLDGFKYDFIQGVPVPYNDGLNLQKQLTSQGVQPNPGPGSKLTREQQLQKVIEQLRPLYSNYRALAYQLMRQIVDKDDDSKDQSLPDSPLLKRK